MKPLPSPLKAIRTKCLTCCNDQSNEVALCGAITCPLYPLRFGKSVAGIRPLTAIVQKCRDCAPDDQPKDCELKTCALWNFREGRNPNRAGAGNRAPNQAGLKNNSRTHAAIQKRTAPCAGLCSCSTPCAVCLCSDRGLE